MRPWRLALAAALSALVLLPAAALAAPLRVLVAAGNDVGLADELPLRHAAADARRIASVFTDLGDVAPEHAIVLENRSADALLKAFDRAARLARGRAPEDVTLIVYFSGHGDEAHLHLSGQRLPVAELERAAARVSAGLRLVILDACRTGAGRPKGFAEVEPFDVRLDAPPGPAGALVLRSSSAGEAAQESDELGGAIFSHYMAAAMRGAGDHDRDGRVTFDEAYAYAYGRTLRRSLGAPGATQHPALRAHVEGAGPLVLTRLSRARASLTLPAGRDVRYLVFHLPSGNVVAEVAALPDATTRLAVPSGRLLVHRRAERDAGAVEVSVPYGGHEALGANAFTPVPLALLVAKGGGLRLRRHLLGARAGAVGTSQALGARARLRYGYLQGAWRLGAGLQLGGANHATAIHDVEERWLGGEARLARLLALGPFELELGVAASVRRIVQRLRHVDADRLGDAGYDLDGEHVAWGAGPSGEVTLRIPVAATLSLEATVGGEAIFARRGGELAPLWDAGLELGLSFEL